MPLKIYKVDLSPPARAVMMVCEALGVAAELYDVNFFEKEHWSPTYLKKNPLHTVPVLEDSDKDVVLHDSHAILMYLVDAYGNSDALYPKDVKQRALVNQKLFFNNSILFHRLRNVAYPAIVEGVKKPSEKFVQDIAEAYGFLEEFLSRSKFLAGDGLTIADIAAIATVTGLIAILPLDQKKYSKTQAWINELEKQSFYEKANLPGSTAYSKLLKEKIEL